jgi:hypothetical protein
MKAPGYSPALTSASARSRTAPRFIANFDSASAMLRAQGRYLRGKDFARLGMLPPTMDLLAPVMNSLPAGIKDTVYTWSGWAEGVPAEKLGEMRAEAISQWMISEYPRMQYPAIMIGSSNGAGVHLGAALGIPWLPQTFLIPVRHPAMSPDEPKEELEWALGPAQTLLKANPELVLHQMHDPNQDRLMIQRMTYFRVKRRRLGETFTRFIEDVLPPGGTIFLTECNLQWPTTRISDRHIFQFGALGGATPDEFYHGSPRVEKYLERYNSHRRRWDPPEPDADRPEAEWGFEPALHEDVERLARRRNYQIRRIVFDQPEDLSPLVADLYRWWYQERRLRPNRLFVESFIVLEPWWTLRTGSVPYWMVFNMEPSAEHLEQYLDGTAPYDEINLTLFSHGVDAVGLPPMERWYSILERARNKGSLVGVDPDVFPRDFAVFVRYYQDIKKIAARYPMPGPMALEQLDQFLDESGSRYQVQWPAGL